MFQAWVIPHTHCFTCLQCPLPPFHLESSYSFLRCSIHATSSRSPMLPKPIIPLFQFLPWLVYTHKGPRLVPMRHKHSIGYGYSYSFSSYYFVLKCCNLLFTSSPLLQNCEHLTNGDWYLILYVHRVSTKLSRVGTGRVERSDQLLLDPLFLILKRRDYQP